MAHISQPRRDYIGEVLESLQNTKRLELQEEELELQKKQQAFQESMTQKQLDLQTSAQKLSALQIASQAGIIDEVNEPELEKIIGMDLFKGLTRPSNKALTLEDHLAMIEAKTAGEIKKEKVKQAGEKEITDIKETGKNKRAQATTALDAADKGLKPGDIRAGAEAMEEAASETQTRTSEEIIKNTATTTLLGLQLLKTTRYSVTGQDVITLVGSKALDEKHPDTGVTLREALRRLNGALNQTQDKTLQDKFIEQFTTLYPRFKALFK